MAHQLCYVSIWIEHQLGYYVSLHIVKRGIIVTATVIEHAVYTHFLEVLQTSLNVLHTWIRCDVIVKVAHIIPYIYMTRNIFPRFHRCLKLALFCCRTIHLSLQWQRQCTYKHSHIVGQTMCWRYSRSGIWWCKKLMLWKTSCQSFHYLGYSWCCRCSSIACRSTGCTHTYYRVIIGHNGKTHDFIVVSFSILVDYIIFIRLIQSLARETELFTVAISANKGVCLLRNTIGKDLAKVVSPQSPIKVNIVCAKYRH